jgi:hypothetical protein
MRWWLVLCVGFLCGLSGCTADDKAGVSLDLQSLNWQTGVIGALLLWMDKSSLWKPIAAALQPIVVFLRQIGIIKSPVIDETPDTLTVSELIEILTGLLSRTDDPALKAQLLGLISTAAQVDFALVPTAEVITNAKVTA